MLSANASMYSIIPSIFWLLYQSFCFSLFRSSAFHFLFRSLYHCSMAAQSSSKRPWPFWIQLTVEPFQLVVVFFESSLIFHCHVVYSPLSYSLSCHSVPATENLCYVSFTCSIPLPQLYVNRLHTVFFNKFQPFSLSFLPFSVYRLLSGTEKDSAAYFFRGVSLFFCFTPNHAPQGSPAWSSHSAPPLPFFSGRYTQWKAPTFPQSADGSS